MEIIVTIQDLRALVSSKLGAVAYPVLTALLISTVGCMADGGAPLEEGQVQDAEPGAESDGAPGSESGKVEKSLDGTCLGLSAAGQGPLGGPNSVAGRCYNVHGQLVDSVAWLPGCIGNNDGQMVWGGLYFDRSCGSCVLEFALPHHYRLACTCRRRDGSWVRDTLQVSEYLYNRNGVLSCH